MGFKLCVLVSMGGWMDEWVSNDGCVGSDECIDVGGGGVYGGLRMAMGVYECYGCLGIYEFL